MESPRKLILGFVGLFVLFSIIFGENEDGIDKPEEQALTHAEKTTHARAEELRRANYSAAASDVSFEPSDDNYERAAVYSVASPWDVGLDWNRPYVPKVITTLSTFRKQNSNQERESGVIWDYYIFGDLDDRSISLIERSDLKYYRLNIMDFDRDNHAKGQRYPAEQFMKYRVPELLAESGYRYSVMIDGDLLSKKPMDIYELAASMEGHEIGGCTIKSTRRDRLGKRLPEKTVDWFLGVTNYTREDLKIHSINVGFIIFDNFACAQKQMWKRFTDMWELTKDRISVKGDGFLFGQIETQMDIVHLPWQWHYRHCFDTKHSQMRDQAINIHFTGSCKPWRDENGKSCRKCPSGIQKKLADMNQWREEALRLFQKEKERDEFFPDWRKWGDQFSYFDF